MLIRKNTKAFKTIVEIVMACQHRADREKLIRLYITKAGHTIRDRIDIEGIQGESDVFYEMNFQTVLLNLKSANHQLHQSDDVPGIYFFHSSSNKAWDETPFEFDERAKKDFGTLPEFPFVRKKGKPGKFVFPESTIKPGSKSIKKEKVLTKKALRIVEKLPKQPDYKLRHEIHFTDLEKIVFANEKLSKKVVLDYYHKIAEYMLPYLRDRHEVIRVQSNGSSRREYTSLGTLAKNGLQLPDWIQKGYASKSKTDAQMILCNDKEHLLFFAETGGVEFRPSHARVKSLELPDYLLIGIESPDATLGNAIEVALIARNILSALRLPSFVKTDGSSGLQVYVPLDAKSKYTTSQKVAEYICKLICLKLPDLVSLKGSENYVYGRISLDYLINEEKNSIVAPYSLVAGDSAIVSTPLLWEEVKEGLQPESFNHETIFKRLKHLGDPFKDLFKKKVNAEALLERMESHYSFLF